MEGIQPVGKAPEGRELIVRYHEAAEERQRAVHQAYSSGSSSVGDGYTKINKSDEMDRYIDAMDTV